MRPEDNKLIARYLLGELSEDERDRVEERLFGDDLFFHEIEAARDQLTEDYLQGRLAGRERERFNAYFLASPSRRERVETTGALIQAANRSAAGEAPAVAFVVRGFGSKEPKLRLWLAAAALIVIVVGALLVIQSIRLQSRVERQRAAVEKEEEALRQQLSEQNANGRQMAEQLRVVQDERARLEEELQALKNGQRVGPEDSSVASLTLSPVLVRDESKTPLLRITPDIRRVRIRVSLDAPHYETYNAALETVEGKQVWHRTGLKASGATVTVYSSASQLPEADYLLTLSGVTSRGRGEEVGKYYFRVASK